MIKINHSISTKELASLLNIRVRRLQRWVKQLRLPHRVLSDGSFSFNLSDRRFSDFFRSIELSLASPHLRPFYSTSDLSKLIQRDRKTIITMLLENDVPCYLLGKRRIILLIDLQRFQASITGKNT